MTIDDELLRRYCESLADGCEARHGITPARIRDAPWKFRRMAKKRWPGKGEMIFRVGRRGDDWVAFLIAAERTASGRVAAVSVVEIDEKRNGTILEFWTVDDAGAWEREV